MNILIPFLVVIVTAVLLKYIMNVVLFNEALTLFNRIFTKNRIFAITSRSPSVKKRIILLRHQQKVALYLQTRIQAMERYAFLPKHKVKLAQAATLYGQTFAKFNSKEKKK
jgi:hypothetical protein